MEKPYALLLASFHDSTLYVLSALETELFKLLLRVLALNCDTFLCGRESHNCFVPAFKFAKTGQNSFTTNATN